MIESGQDLSRLSDQEVEHMATQPGYRGTTAAQRVAAQRELSTRYRLRKDDDILSRLRSYEAGA